MTRTVGAAIAASGMFRETSKQFFLLVVIAPTRPVMDCGVTKRKIQKSSFLN